MRPGKWKSVYSFKRCLMGSLKKRFQAWYSEQQ
ncbi:hypothetical protein T08_4253 [Trichinella sp. T8]|nr:hypothetical protein T08_4253 [Trichinella sp. T8]